MLLHSKGDDYILGDCCDVLRVTSVQAIWMVDTKGLITTSRGDELPSHKKLFARKDGPNIKVTQSACTSQNTATLPLTPTSSRTRLLCLPRLPARP